MTTQGTAALLVRLRARAGPRVKLPLDELWLAFDQVAPELAGQPGARARLAQWLEEAVHRGQAEYPKGRAAWDHAAAPPLPHWVKLPTAGGSPREEIAARPETAWAPELAWAARVTRPEQLELLSKIQQFLACGGRERPIVPERERSAELFDDEKRLERLRKETTLFAPGRLSHALLRCWSPPPPLVWRGFPGPPGRPLLVLENHHTYLSFGRWAEAHGTLAAVVYGAGQAVVRSITELAEVRTRSGAGRQDYFGDLDPRGLAIARLASAAAVAAGLGPLTPAPWYATLLQRGRGRRFPLDDRRWTAEDLAWLDEPLRGPVAELFGAGLRLPQELVGWEVLELAPLGPRRVPREEEDHRP